MTSAENFDANFGNQSASWPNTLTTLDALAHAVGRLGLNTTPRFFSSYNDNGQNYRLITNCWHEGNVPSTVAFAYNIEGQAPDQPEHIRSYMATSGIFDVASKNPVFSISNQGIGNFDMRAQNWLPISMRTGKLFPYIYVSQQTGGLAPLVSARGMYAKLGWHARRRYSPSAASDFVDVVSQFHQADEVEQYMIAPWVLAQFTSKKDD